MTLPQVNTTKIHSVNSSGNFTVTSIPLTYRQPQDIQPPLHYHLLFDLIAHKFNKSTLRPCPSRQTAPHLGAPIKPAGNQIPALSATKSTEAVLTPQAREHQQDRGCTKFASYDTRLVAPSALAKDRLNSPAQRQHRPQTFTTKSAERPLATSGLLRTRTRPQNSPYGSPSRIAARSVGALPTLPEHTHHNRDTTGPQPPSPINARSVDVVLPRHNTILSSFHRPHLNSAKSADPILPPRARACLREATDSPQVPQSVSRRNLSSTLSFPAPAMAPKHPHHLEPDSPDLSTAIGNFHQSTSLSTPKDSVFSLRNAKKALRTRTAEKKADQKERERAEKAAKKTEKENAEAAKRAGREQREATDKMKKLEMEAEKQRLRREEQTANMKKQRRREEEKERVAELSRHKRALEGMSWGFDPGAGMRVNRDSGNGHRGTIDVEGSGGHGELEEAGLQKTRRGSTWGITGGGPGRTGGDHGSDVSRL